MVSDSSSRLKGISVCFWKEMFDHKLIYRFSGKFCIKKNKSIDLHTNQPLEPIKDVHKILVYFDLPSLQFRLTSLPFFPMSIWIQKTQKNHWFLSYNSNFQSYFWKEHIYISWSKFERFWNSCEQFKSVITSLVKAQ